MKMNDLRSVADRLEHCGGEATVVLAEFVCDGTRHHHRVSIIEVENGKSVLSDKLFTTYEFQSTSHKTQRMAAALALAAWNGLSPTEVSSPPQVDAICKLAERLGEKEEFIGTLRSKISDLERVVYLLSQG